MRNKGNIKSKLFTWGVSIFFILAMVLLGYSIYLKQVPDKTSQYLWGKISGNKVKLLPSVDSLTFELDKAKLVIDSLKTELKKYERVNIHKKAQIDVVGGTLNMRDKPLLASSVIARIPDSSFVDVLYFDIKFYYLEGERGRWTKIKYLEQEGWVWDGFIKMQGED